MHYPVHYKRNYFSIRVNDSFLEQLTSFQIITLYLK